MDISQFQSAVASRTTRWHMGIPQWSLLEWAGAMCGESGEASNYAKKIKRLDQGLPNKEAGIDSSDRPGLETKCAQEVADSIIYGMSLLSELGRDASLELQRAFDRKSIEYGFPERAPR